jgi:hypothetical protein
VSKLETHYFGPSSEKLQEKEVSMARISGKNEKRCLDLVQKVLGGTPYRQRYSGWDDLRGDPTPKLVRGKKLQVDGYFPQYNLVVEYMGQQHDPQYPHFDKRPGRREQRKRYQERRSEYFAKNDIKIVRFYFSELLTDEGIKEKLQKVGIRL